MGLIHATNLGRWEEWRRSRELAAGDPRALITARGRGTDDAGPRLVLRSRDGAAPGDVSRRAVEGTAPRILLALDEATPAARASLLTVLPYLHGAVDVLQPAGAEIPETHGEGWTGSDPAGMTSDQVALALPGRGITRVVSLGQHRPAGRAAHLLARAEGLESYVVQHDVLTPYAPPLPPESTLLAWTDADAEFWRSGRRDVVARVLGSQLLWQARHQSTTPERPTEPTPQNGPQNGGPALPAPIARPVFLGQLRAPELPRRVTGRAASLFCRLHDGLYRPGDDETDRLSRAVHALWRRRGVEILPHGTPLRVTGGAVVSVSSAAVLEAAARGIPSWVFAPQGPGWLDELWDRYGMRRFGAAQPTGLLPMPAAEPAAALAEILDAAP